MISLPNVPDFDPITALAALDARLLAHTVVSAQISDTGELSQVGGIDTGEKLFAAISCAEFPRITHFGMSDKQPGLTNREDPAHKWGEHLDGHRAPQFVAAANLLDLVRQLRWRDYLRDGVVLEDFIGALRRGGGYRPFQPTQRDWLRIALVQKMEECSRKGGKASGYLLLTMPAGWGKTAFMIDLIERGELGGAQVLAWHFARRGRGRQSATSDAMWDSTAMLAGQIEGRLRTDLAIPLPCCRSGKGGICTQDAANPAPPLPTCRLNRSEDPRRRIESDDHAKAVLHDAIRDAGKSLKPGQKIIICIDGLDEAFGTLGRYSGDAGILPGLLPNRHELPEGVFFLLTSRPGSHLSAWLSDPGQVERIRLEEGMGDPAWRQGQKADILYFLRNELDAAAELHNLAKPEDLITQRVVDACEDSFFVAAWFANHMQTLSGFDEIADTSRVLPQGLDDILRWDWEVAQQKAGNSEALRALLGILAAARGAPSKDLLRQVLAPSTDEGFPEPCDASRDTLKSTLADLRLVGSFFDADLSHSGALLDWAHTGIPDWILATQSTGSGGQPPFLSAEEIRACHATWAHACRRWESLPTDPADSAAARLRRYALLWLPWHEAMAGQVSEAEDTLRDYPGWLCAGYEQARRDPSFASEWPTVMQESISTALAVREALRPRAALTPEEYFRYIAASGWLEIENGS